MANHDLFPPPERPRPHADHKTDEDDARPDHEDRFHGFRDFRGLRVGDVPPIVARGVADMAVCRRS